MAHYLLYWPLKAVEYRYYGEALDHLRHDAMARTETGDVIWIVTARAGDLLLTGRFVVGEVMDEAEQSIDPTSYWSARWHAAAEPGTEETMRLVNLSELSITLSLRFESKADRLRLNRQGRLNVMSLYHMRRLTDESAALLTYAWYNDDPQAVEAIDMDEDTFIYAEGKPQVKQRVLRQRSSKIASQAKDRYVETHGELRCEVCGINFAEIYGVIGEGYMEAHHPQPLSELDGEYLTDVDDIVLVCANCHRMAHRKTPPYSIKELKEAVRKNRGTYGYQ